MDLNFRLIMKSASNNTNPNTQSNYARIFMYNNPVRLKIGKDRPSR